MRKTAIVATSQHIGAYGGHQIPEDVLNGFVEQLMEPGFAFNIDHDPRQGLQVRVVRAWTERHADGYLLLKAELESSPEAWDSAGDRIGVSISYAAPISLPPRGSAFDLTADAYWFDESAMREASEAFTSRGHATSVHALFQFNQEPDPWIYMTMVLDQLKGVPSGLLSAMIWDALKPLLSRFRSKATESSTPASVQTKVQLKVELPDGTNTTAHIDTESETVAMHAISQFMDVVSQQMDVRATPGSESSGTGGVQAK